MMKPGTLVLLAGALSMSLASGCAPGYYAYGGCGVDCQYCAPPPLPFGYYPECVCHSCAASRHFSRSGAPRAEPESIESSQTTEDRAGSQ